MLDFTYPANEGLVWLPHEDLGGDLHVQVQYLHNFLAFKRFFWNLQHGLRWCRLAHLAPVTVLLGVSILLKRTSLRHAHLDVDGVIGGPDCILNSLFLVYHVRR